MSVNNISEIINAFKEKYNDVMDLSFQPYDTAMPSFKAFNGDDAICSISINPITNTYKCWYGEDYLVTTDKDKAMIFLKI